MINLIFFGNRAMDNHSQDLTRGSIPSLLVRMAIPIGIGLLMQTLYFVVDLYFVSSLGEEAIAGVGIAGNLNFLIIATTQVFNVGVTALISQAVGRKDVAEAGSDFNQALLLCGVFSLATLVLGYGLGETYIRQFSESHHTIQLGTTYLWYFLPNMALQFALTVMIAGLRGVGVVKPTMVLQMVGVLLNVILTPILVSGWLTGHPLGVAGAGLSSSIASALGLILLIRYFKKTPSFLSIQLRHLRPNVSTWGKILGIGLPTGGEFLIMFVYMAIIYGTLQTLGSHAQAGFGIGQRILQSLLMPGLALSFAAPAIVGQNYGAGHGDRIRETLASLLKLNAILLGALGAICVVFGGAMTSFFTDEAEVLAVGSDYLFWTGFSFLSSIVLLSCNGIYQGLGNTLPALLSSVTRISIVIIGCFLLVDRPDFHSTQLWQLSFGANMVQATMSFLLLKRMLKQKLTVIHKPA